MRKYVVLHRNNNMMEQRGESGREGEGGKAGKKREHTQTVRHVFQHLAQIGS